MIIWNLVSSSYYGPTHMLAIFQRALDKNLSRLQGDYYFLGENILVTKGHRTDHVKSVKCCPKKFEFENFSVHVVKFQCLEEDLNGCHQN